MDLLNVCLKKISKYFFIKRIIFSFALNKRLKQMFKEKNNPDVKDRILHVARQLFIKNGYANTSVRDIANASETNVAMVNYYFNSKYNLFELIFEEALAVLMNRVSNIVYSDKPFPEVIASWIDSYYETLLEYPQIPIFILNEINQNPERLTQRVRKYEPYNIFLRISLRVEEEVKKGTICETSPLDLLLNILSLCIFPFIFGGMATKVAGKTQEEYNEVLEEHKKYVINSVLKGLEP